MSKRKQAQSRKERKANAVEAAAGEEPRAAAEAAPRSRRRPFRLAILLLVLVAVAWFGGRYGLKRHWMNEAERALHSYRFAKAEEVFDRAGRWFRSDGQIDLMQARLYRLKGDAARTMQHLQAAAEKGVPPNRIGVEEQLIKIQSGQAAQYRNLFPILVQMTEREGMLALEAYALGYALAGQYPESQEMLRTWMQADPQDARPLYWMGTVLQQNDYAEEAREAFRRALALDPHLVRARAALADSFLRSGYTVRAAEQYRLAVAQEPENRQWQIDSATLDLELGDTENAVAVLEDEVRRQPSHYDAVQALALHYQRQQQPRDVLRLIEPIIELFPRDASLNYLLAAAYSAVGQEQRSAGYYDVFLESNRQLAELEQRQRQLEHEEPTPEEAIALAEGFLQFEWRSSYRWINTAAMLAPRDPRTGQMLARYERLSRGLPANPSAPPASGSG